MSRLLEGLNEAQKQSVTHTSGPLLIVAGAGTGKTTVITRRIAYLIDKKHAQPDEILALAYNEKAAAELEDRALQLLPIGNYDLWISTFHSFCERILHQYALDIGLPTEFELLDETKQWLFVHKNLDQFQLDYYSPLGNPNKFIKNLLDHFSSCKDNLISPEQYISFAEKLNLSQGSADTLAEDNELESKKIAELANAYHTYQNLLIKNGKLDFGDLIFYAVRLLQKRPNIAKILHRKFKFIMVDEFQDTNLAQYELVRLLSGEEQNLVAVGDDDQSIYEFRGASVSNILKLKKDYANLKEITLKDNYRSSQKILDLAYNFIQHNNPDRLETQLKIDKRLIGHNLDRTKIEVLEAEDLTGELNLVADTIVKTFQSEDSLTWNDFCILVRANSAAHEISAVLEAKNIPFSFVANTGLYFKPLIIDLVNYLKLLDNYHESASLYKVLNFPKFKIDSLDLANLTELSRKKVWSLYEAIDSAEASQLVSEKTFLTLSTLKSLISSHTALARDKSAMETFVEIVADLGVEKLLEHDNLENFQNRELLEQFYKKIENYCRSRETSDNTIKGFLRDLDLEIESGAEGRINFDPQSGPESVKVMTIHAAKGLEFEHVFLINMVDQRFPTRTKASALELPEQLISGEKVSGNFHLQEERRLFYVAATRAKTHLYFSWSKNYGGSRQKKPSIFLTESGLLPAYEAKKPTGQVVFLREGNSDFDSQQIAAVLPEKFSYSQISTFLKCPLEYYFYFVLKMPKRGNHQLSFGQTIHNTLQKFLTEFEDAQKFNQLDLLGKVSPAKFPDKKNLFALYEQEWIDDWFQSKSQKTGYKKRGLEILNTFYEVSLKNLPQPKLLEANFFIKLGESSQYTFNGKIDRADLGPHGLKILDYKTSEKVPKKAGKEDIDQLRIYQLAAVEFFHEKVESLSYWYLYPNQIVNIDVADNNSLHDLKNRLVEIIESIRLACLKGNFKQLDQKIRHECEFKHLI